MQKSPARKALEHYFAARLEIRKQFDSGVLDYLRYELKKRHYRDQLINVKPGGALAHAALHRAVMECDPSHYLKGSDRDAAYRLKKYDPDAYTAWRRQWMIVNIEPAAYRILDMYEGIKGVEDIPVPAPNPKKIEAYEKAHNHRIGSGPEAEPKMDQYRSNTDSYENSVR